MKKTAILLLAVLLCLSTTVSACAETGVTLVKEGMKDVRWISDTNLLRYEGKEGYGMMTVDGTELTEAVYSNLDGEYGYVSAAKPTDENRLNVFGVLAQDGTEVVPFEYGDIKFESCEWVLGFVLKEATADNYDYKNFWGEDAYYLIDTVDIYHMPEANKVASLPRENFLDADAVNHCLNIQNREDSVVTTYDAAFNALGTVRSTYSEDLAPADIQTYRDNGQTGLMDAEGNIIMKPAFKYINNIYGNYASVSTGDKEGLIDLQGNVILPAEYESVKSIYNLPFNEETNRTSGYVACGYIYALADGKVVFADVNGNVTYNTGYSKDVVDVKGASALLTDLQGNVHILAADGADTVVEGYDKVYELAYGSGMYYRTTSADYKYGVIDWHGNVILEAECDSVNLSADGQYLLAGDYKNGYNLYTVSYPEVGEAAVTVSEESASGDASAEAATIQQIITLLESDPAANKDAASILLKNAAEALADTAAASILNSCVTLLDTDAEANASSIITLLNNAAEMVK